MAASAAPPLARQRLEYLFSDVEHLPAAYNKADSAAEEKGLRETFRLMGELVLHDPTPPKPGTIHRSLVRQMYDSVWLPARLKPTATPSCRRNQSIKCRS